MIEEGVLSSLNDYKRELQHALRKGSEYHQFNKDMSHARVVICTAFEHAKSKIRLLSNQLDRELYGTIPFEAAMQKFLENGGHELVLLVETDVSEDHPVRQMARRFPGQVTMARVPDNLQEYYPHNCMLVDESGYRLEADRDKPEAIVVFNDQGDDLRPMLSDHFAALEEQAESVPL